MYLKRTIIGLFIRSNQIARIVVVKLSRVGKRPACIFISIWYFQDSNFLAYYENPPVNQYYLEFYKWKVLMIYLYLSREGFSINTMWLYFSMFQSHNNFQWFGWGMFCAHVGRPCARHCGGWKDWNPLLFFFLTSHKCYMQENNLKIVFWKSEIFIFLII